MGNICMRAQPFVRSAHRTLLAPKPEPLDNKFSELVLVRTKAHLRNLGEGFRRSNDSRYDLPGGVTAHQVPFCKLQKHHKGRQVQLEDFNLLLPDPS